MTHVSVYIGDIAGDIDDLFLRGYDSSGTLVASDAVTIPLEFIGFRLLSIKANGIASIEFGGSDPLGRNSIFADSLVYSSDPLPEDDNDTGVSAVPLPASFPLLLAGFAAFGALRRSRR